MMQYIGRLYDHDPDDIKRIQELHDTLAENNQDYDVDTIMKSVCLITKYSPHSILLR